MDTLYHFVSLFDYDSLDSEAKNKLHNSVSLIITKTEGVTSPDRATNNLRKIIAGYQKKVIVTKK